MNMLSSVAATFELLANTSLSLGGLQFFFIVIVIFAILGFQRGWRRELVTFGFTMGGLLLLFIDQGRWLADFIFNKLPQIGGMVVENSSVVTFKPKKLMTHLRYHTSHPKLQVT